MSSRWMFVVAGVGAGCVVTAAALAAGSESPRWRVTDLGTLGGRFSVAVAINDGGDVVGTSGVASRARHVFLWRGGEMIDLGFFRGEYCCPPMQLEQGAGCSR